MKTLNKIILAMALSFSLMGCANMSKQDMGMVGGGVLGGIAGRELTGGSTVGVIGGAVGGAYLGSQLAK